MCGIITMVSFCSNPLAIPVQVYLRRSRDLLKCGILMEVINRIGRYAPPSFQLSDKCLFFPANLSIILEFASFTEFELVLGYGLNDGLSLRLKATVDVTTLLHVICPSADIR